MSRELDSEHLSEQRLQAGRSALRCLHATDGMPIDEHCQLCSELWFKQRQLATAWCRAPFGPQMLAVYVKTLAGPEPAEDAAAGLCALAQEISGSISFSNAAHCRFSSSWISCTRRHALHDSPSRLTVAAQSWTCQMQGAHHTAVAPWHRFAKSRERGRASCARRGLKTSHHYQSHEQRELPRAMLDAAMTTERGDGLIAMRGSQSGAKDVKLIFDRYDKDGLATLTYPSCEML